MIPCSSTRSAAGAPGRLRLVLSVVAVACATATIQAQSPGMPPAAQYAITAWPAQKGEPGDIFAITQDLEGYLWLGTPTGLLRFDGSEFLAWSPPPGADPLPNSPVHALLGSQHGAVWVGFGGGGGVARIEGDRIVRYTPADGAPPGVNALLEDRQGVIWAAGNRGLFRFVGDRWSRVTAEEGFDREEAFTLYEDRAGRLWVSTGAGLYRRSDAGFQLVNEALKNVQSLTEDEAGHLWVTSGERIVQRVGSHGLPHHAPAIRLPVSGWRVMRDRRGSLWVATFGGGLLRVADPASQAALLEPVSYEHRLSGSPRALFQDRDDNIWVGMRGGLLRLKETSIQAAGPLAGITHDGVRTAAAGPDAIWVATTHSLNRFSASGHEVYDVPQTSALHRDARGVMWVVTDRRVGRLVNGRLVPEDIPGLEGNRVRAITSTRDRLWLCTALLGVVSWDGLALTSYDASGDGTNPGCLTLFTDRQDRVWTGFMSGGVAVYERGVFRGLHQRRALTPGPVLAITEATSGALWFATTEGVSRYHNGRVTAITRRNAPLDAIVPVLVQDEDGYIWVGVQSGAAVVRFHPREVDKVADQPDYRLVYELYDASDGMQQGSQTYQGGVGGVRDRDGRLWVATGLGMVIVDPRRLPETPQPSPPRIDLATVNGRRLDPAVHPDLPAGATLQVRYGALSLAAASKLRFRHMLEGLDRDWVYDPDNREASYTDLQPGDYRFRMSTTHDGQWTDAGVWAFSVAPPVYLRPWFLALAAACLVAMAAASAWMRLRAVKSRYALVFAERTRMSREIHDTLLQSLAALGMELEALAAAPVRAHDDLRTELRRVRRQVSRSLRDARDSILQLRRHPVATLRLPVSLREFADDVASRCGVRIGLDVAGRRPERASADVELQLLRIAQEAVNNAIRHGRATDVQITVTYEGDRVTLTVADNGCGFTVDERALLRPSGEHFGLVTMRERAERVRGELRIESRPGRGTLVETVVRVAA